MIKVDDLTFNQAFFLYQEFGPNRRIPADKRIHAKFPLLSNDQINDLIQRFQMIESFAFDVAEQMHNKLIDNIESKNKIASQFPELNTERVTHTINQAMYFSCK